MSIPVDHQSSSIPAYQATSPVKEGQVKGEFKSFTQQVQVGDKSFTVTLHYPKDRAISMATVERDMKGQIGKMVLLATELGLGENGLEKIKMTQNEVIGKWNEGGTIVKKNIVEKLRQEHTEAAGNPEKLLQIEKKLKTLGKVSTVFSNIIPSTVSANRGAAVLSEVAETARPEPLERQPEGASVKGLEREFYTEYNKALTSASGIEREEKAKLSELMTKYSALSEELDTLVQSGNASPEEIAKLRTELGERSLELKNKFDTSQKDLFSGLEEHLSKMTAVYNGVVEERKALEAEGSPANAPRIKQLKALEEKMGAKIRECNTVIGHTALSTNAFSATKAHVFSFGAVLDKRMALLERKHELEATGKKSGELKKINKELAKAPDSATMKKSAEEIQKKLEKSAIQIVSQKDAKEINKEHPELSWGASHVVSALTTPANWTEVRTALIKESKSGFMHTAVSVLTPLNIKAEGGVPAGLRSKEGYDTRTTNLIKTTNYILGADGEKSDPVVSFRGGQFPTKEAAKEAILTIMQNLPKGQKLEFMHINTLLTPTAVTAIKEDKHLLAAHKQSVQDALSELIGEADGELKATLQKLKDNVGMSNSGVNEGAVGELKFLGIRIKLGWHTSIAEYTNDASQKLNKAVFSKLESMSAKTEGEEGLDGMVGDLDRLGAMLQVGQELEAVYANNDYADARVGDNQFKMAALWKTMDVLIGVPCYTNCMSGKDRTGKVESNAHEYLDEITMNIADHKRELSKEFQKLKGELPPEQQLVWEAQEKVLTAACFKKEDLAMLHGMLKDLGPEEFQKGVSLTVKEKIAAVKEGLGMEDGPDGFMIEKKGIPRSVFRAGVDGIPTNIPKLQTKGETQSLFPPIAVSSMYGREPVDFSKLTPTQMNKLGETLAARQREAVNRRLSQLSGSLQVTQINTGRPGFKIDVGEPLAKFSSGFDREYVLYKLQTANSSSPDFFFELDKWTGMHELDENSRQEYQSRIHAAAQDRSLSPGKRLETWTQILREIEVDKMESMVPKAKVKS